MAKKQSLNLLFIGNSHTYYNDMPMLVKHRSEDEGYSCHVTMLAHPGWFLSQHVQEPDVRFNILYGGYDYVIIQEHAHPFGPEKIMQMQPAASTHGSARWALSLSSMKLGRRRMSRISKRT